MTVNGGPQSIFLAAAPRLAPGLGLESQSPVRCPAGDRRRQWHDPYRCRIDAELVARISLVLLFAAIGASIGSFLCVVLERVPRGESIGGRSHCVCGRQLTWWENIPIVSWLVLRGKARCCGARIPLRYLGFELISAVVGGVVGVAARVA